MVASSVISNLKLLAASKGGASDGSEETTAKLVRARLNARTASAQVRSVMRAQLVHGLAPIALYVQRVLPQSVWKPCTPELRSEFVYECLEVVAARTKLLTRYDPVLSEDDEWAQVTKALSDVFAGKNPPAPSYEEREAELGGHDAGLERKGSAWRHTNFIATVMGTAGLLWCYFLPAVFGGTGRAKIKSGMVATLMLGGAFFFVCHGPKYFFFFREDVDDATSEASSVGEAEQIGGDDSKDELEALKKDMGELKKANAERSRPADLPSPAKPLPEPPTHTMSAAGVGLDPQSSPFMQPMVDFATDAQAAGPISQSAPTQHFSLDVPVGAPQQGQSSASYGMPPGLPWPSSLAQGGLPPAGRGSSGPPLSFGAAGPAPQIAMPNYSGPVWHPNIGLEAVKRQATILFNLYNECQASSATNPFGGKEFWETVGKWIAQLGQSGGSLSQDLQRLLQAHGHFGPGTVAPPRPDIVKDLESFRLTGAPMPGTGLAALDALQSKQMQAAVPWPGQAQASSLEAAAEAASDGRWHTALPPDLRRAAPEIYRSMRAAGAASVRGVAQPLLSGLEDLRHVGRPLGPGYRSKLRPQHGSVTSRQDEGAGDG